MISLLIRLTNSNRAGVIKIVIVKLRIMIKVFNQGLIKFYNIRTNPKTQIRLRR